jgi:hypothetical protein
VQANTGLPAFMYRLPSEYLSRGVLVLAEALASLSA